MSVLLTTWIALRKDSPRSRGSEIGNRLPGTAPSGTGNQLARIYCSCGLGLRNRPTTMDQRRNQTRCPSSTLAPYYDWLSFARRQYRSDAATVANGNGTSIGGQTKPSRVPSASDAASSHRASFCFSKEFSEQPKPKVNVIKQQEGWGRPTGEAPTKKAGLLTML